MTRSSIQPHHRFGNLTVVAEGPVYVSPKKRRQRQWVCRCSCGNTATVLANNLKRGKTRSCGCNRGVKQPAETRFWERVRKEPYGCWVWTGGLFSNGYGRLADRKEVSAHRFSWELHFGPIPEGYFVLHTCDNRRCVRPRHLFLGTHLDNMQDMITKGRGPRKLREEDVRSIRQRAKEGETQVRLAEEYGVNKTTIGHIVKRRTWKHLV